MVEHDKYLFPWKESYDKPRQCIKNEKQHFVDKVLDSQSYDFFHNHVGMWELDHKESWVAKSWRFWAVVLEKTLESPLDCKEILPVKSKGNQSSTFVERTDIEAEAPILWPSDLKNWLIGKDPDVGKDWRWGGEGDDRGRDG